MNEPLRMGCSLRDQPVKSLTYKSITIEGFSWTTDTETSGAPETTTVEGYSRAAVQTYWRIPEFNIGFDLGGQPWSFMGTPTWFVSHTHMDHILALPAYVARRRMMKMDPPTIYLPEAAIEPLEHLLREYSRLDRGNRPHAQPARSTVRKAGPLSKKLHMPGRSRLPCVLRPMRAGDEIEISRELVVTVSATRHTIPSLGFVVWERRKKLKPEYQGLPGNAIRDLRLSGTEVTRDVRIPRLAYLGDSAPEGLDACPAMYEAEVLIFELTFVAPSHRKDLIHKFGHIHLDDVVERKHRFRNDVLIAAHFSMRYTPRAIERAVRRAFPDLLGGRLNLWL